MDFETPVISFTVIADTSCMVKCALHDMLYGLIEAKSEELTPFGPRV